MSIDTCNRCDGRVDTDWDDDCYVDADTCLCYRCRDAIYCEQQNQINDEERA